jgi:hypothetical protein
LADTLYTLGDGVVMGIGKRATTLINLLGSDEIKIADAEYAGILEKLTLGWDLQGWEERLPRMLDDGVVSEGPLTLDPVLRDHLARMDRMFFSSTLATLTPRARQAYEQTLAAHAWRKRFFTQAGQCPVLPETAMRRALLIGDAQEVGARDVLCLGDDDLVSIPLAALGHRVTVYDVDPFLVALLRRLSVALSLEIDLRERNVLEPLEPGEQARFDLFVTDPMSNRECFEIFLSRALAMTRPGGRGFTAVYGPAHRLLVETAAAMRFTLCNRHVRHNRYYSQYFKVHSYESDWVEIERSADTRLAFAAGARASADNLYSEAVYHRPSTFCAFYDDIEDLPHARPLFIDMVIDMVEAGTGLKLEGRVVHAGEGWSVIHGRTRDGHLTLHVDRDRRQMSVEIFPARVEIEDTLRHTLMAGYKTRATTAHMVRDRDLWDLRVR